MITRITRLLALSLAALIALAGTGEAQQKKIKHDPNLISLEELTELQGHNAYEVVEKLRPDWLRRSERRVTLGTRRMDRGSDSRASARIRARTATRPPWRTSPRHPSS